MVKYGIVLGVLLMVAAFAALALFLLGTATTDPSVRGLMNTLFCAPGETYREELGAQTTNAFNRPAGRSFTAVCTAANGEEREVTDRAILVMAAGFVAPLIAGLLLTLGSGIVLARHSRRSQPEPNEFWAPGFDFTDTLNPGSATTITVTGKRLDELPPEARDKVNRILQGFGVSTPVTDGDLSTKLRQLQEARDGGLLSQQEYDRLRQQILDGLSE